ncbi:MAG TPA: acyltransferase [Parafilimonas sp.]|nr:acyltransferase [Parafilimonas sp.]
MRKLDGYSSIFLDSIRLICALIVVIGHCRQILAPDWHVQTGIFDLGHGAVIVFFVLSGFVIAHTVTSKKRTINNYLVARFSRLYSIYAPALLITLFCALLSFFINKSIYFQYDRGNNILRYFLTLFFCNELWFSSTAPPINGPFWSLSFEFWYYIIFALVYFKWGNLRGMFALALVCLFIGPKILAMFPIWCFGWFAYKIKTLNIRPFIARIISLLFLVTAVLLMKILPEYPNKVGYKPLYMANAFISDMLTGFFAAISMWFLPTNTERRLNNSASVSRFRFYANLTYPLYLLHFPILVLLSTILHNYNFAAINNYFIGLVSTLILCFLLGAFFEREKGFWDHLFQKEYIKKVNGYTLEK